MDDTSMTGRVPDAGNWTCYTTAPAESLEIFEAARSKCPVAHSTGHDGFYMLLGQSEVRRAMSDHRTFSSQPQVLRPMLPRKAIPALEMDPPRHGAWRAIFSSAITMKTPDAMEPFVRKDIRRHIDGFIERGECDIVRDLAEPVPAETICNLVGIDEGNVPVIRDRAMAMIAAQGDPELFGRRLAEFAEVTVSEVHERRANPRNDFLTSLAGTEVEGRPFEDDDYVVLLAAFLGAGHHSTTSAMSSLVYEIFSRPDVRDRLLREPSRIPVAVEEALRLRPPFFGFFRRTTKPVETGGVEIASGTDVYVGWAAANRDPNVHERPTEFSLDRSNTRHMSFGFGIHVCPGAPLARMELRVLVEELLSALPDLKVPEKPPVYQFGGGDYSFIPSLPVTFEPRARPLREA